MFGEMVKESVSSAGSCCFKMYSMFWIWVAGDSDREQRMANSISLVKVAASSVLVTSPNIVGQIAKLPWRILDEAEISSGLAL